MQTYCIGHAFWPKLQLAAVVAHKMLATQCAVAIIGPTITRRCMKRLLFTTWPSALLARRHVPQVDHRGMVLVSIPLPLYSDCPGNACTLEAERDGTVAADGTVVVQVINGGRKVFERFATNSAIKA